MSLGRLLTAGRSLVGGSNSELHYRMTSALPKFNSKKNPFRSQASSQTLLADTGRIPVPATAPVAAPAPQPAPVPAAAPSKAQAPAAPGRLHRAMASLRSRVARLFTWLSRPRPAAAKPAVPRLEKLPIQAELSLDRITVVRNDLSDADLEIVPRTAAAPAKAVPSPALNPEPMLVPAAEPVSAPAPKLGMARMAWNRAGRLLGAGKS